MKKRKWFLYFIPVFVWMAVIFIFSSQPDDISSNNNYFVLNLLNSLSIDLVKLLGSDFANFIIRKAGHVTEFFILFMLSYYAFHKVRFKQPLLYGSILTVIYASSDEFHQMFVPGRGPMVRDVLIDSIGVLIGILVILLIRKPLKRGVDTGEKRSRT